jgi:predicted tellurium resistance membrane protein TerC
MALVGVIIVLAIIIAAGIVLAHFFLLFMWPILFIVACVVLTLLFVKLIVGGVQLIQGDTEGLIEEEHEGFDQYEGRHRAPKSFDDAMEGFEPDLSRSGEMYGPWRPRDWRANRID